MIKAFLKSIRSDAGFKNSKKACTILILAIINSVISRIVSCNDEGDREGAVTPTRHLKQVCLMLRSPNLDYKKSSIHQMERKLNTTILHLL